MLHNWAFHSERGNNSLDFADTVFMASLCESGFADGWLVDLGDIIRSRAQRLASEEF